MSIRHGLLALLEPGSRYGSQLRTEFEARTATSWPLNIGQVYTTLGRLERDGMVVQEGVDEARRVRYALTEAGRAELRAWYARPVERATPPRDELAIKLVMAVAAPGVDAGQVLRTQRRHVTEALRTYVRERERALARAAPGHPEEVARLLLLEQRVCHAEAELRWLDHCEARLSGLT
ncbi:PadR family transcriptional regulator [Streptomyces sp. B93]|uniref:PadR family transcriptional regulator n=1 Tax=Streptomyces sp. B93 TaxID=2824875 RepID=UPI001B36969E|nr:PadR family transcriptional regulator [Streptomyces sp. B93]MBQ1090958.1 PadR family transcriptional regulator [Streptomyces sp. B93]